MRKLGVYSRLSGAGKVRGPEDCGLEREKRGLGTIWGHRGGGPRGPGFEVAWPRPSVLPMLPPPRVHPAPGLGAWSVTASQCHRQPAEDRARCRSAVSARPGQVRASGGSESRRPAPASSGRHRAVPGCSGSPGLPAVLWEGVRGCRCPLAEARGFGTAGQTSRSGRCGVPRRARARS